MPLTAKLKHAGIVVDNNGGREELQRQVERVAVRLQRRAGLWGLLTSPASVAAAGLALWAALQRL